MTRTGGPGFDRVCGEFNGGPHGVKPGRNLSSVLTETLLLTFARWGRSDAPGTVWRVGGFSRLRAVGWGNRITFPFGVDRVALWREVLKTGGVYGGT
jgi:hypothetical protein